MGTRHGSSWPNTARSVPHSWDKIREPADQAYMQTGYGVGEKDPFSFTHSNLHRANKRNQPVLAFPALRSVAPADFFSIMLGFNALRGHNEDMTDSVIRGKRTRAAMQKKAT